MGFFDRLYYGKAGKADYTEMDMPKNRISLFFLVLKDHFFDLIKVNFLQLVFWIPFLIWSFMNLIAVQSMDVDAMLAMENGTKMITDSIRGYLFVWLVGLIPCVAITGPSSAGSAYIMRNWARDQHAFLFSDFKDAFKGNWKQALASSVMTAFVPVLAYTAVTFYGELAGSNVVMLAPMIIVFSAVLMWTLMLPLIYPMMIGYELRLKDIFKNALLMACARLPQMLFARIVTLIPVVLLLVSIYIGNSIMMLIMCAWYLLFGFAFSRLVYASVANGIFDRYINPHIEGAPIRQGLRPQTEEDELLDDDDEDEEEF